MLKIWQNPPGKINNRLKVEYLEDPSREWKLPLSGSLAREGCRLLPESDLEGYYVCNLLHITGRNAAVSVVFRYSFGTYNVKNLEEPGGIGDCLKKWIDFCESHEKTICFRYGKLRTASWAVRGIGCLMVLLMQGNSPLPQRKADGLFRRDCRHPVSQCLGAAASSPKKIDHRLQPEPPCLLFHANEVSIP